MLDKNLSQWLQHIQNLHVKDMDLSLERVQRVFERLGVLPRCPVITVGGTNGKGSCVAGLEKIYMEAGYRVGAYTSPILFRHNEYVRIQGEDVSDELFCDAFEKVESARGDIALTLFEFNTLAAFVMFAAANLDVWILEVGLGGRFDAVNAVDADVAIVASIDLDHMEWLGDTREKIGFEKAGIFRGGKSAICGDFDPPKSLSDHAKKIGAEFFCQGKDFSFSASDMWNWKSDKSFLENLPQPKLALQNMSTVLMAVELLQNKLPVKRETIDEALANLSLRGRIQVIEGDVTQIFDVSHNPAAARFLADFLQKNKINGKTRAVFSMLADKDILNTLVEIKNEIDEWFIAPLNIKRGASIEMLEKQFQKADIKNYQIFESIKKAHHDGLSRSMNNDRLVVFGSFHVVGLVLPCSDKN
jgi:dihydrofolate synthase/folylpolyglutamate synthase